MDLFAKLLQYEGNIYTVLGTSLLVMARLLGMLTLIPFLGGKMVPTQVKVSTGIALTLLVYPIAGAAVTTPLPDLGPVFSTYLMKEVFVGTTIGFVASLIFQALESAGQFLDTARGSSLANIMIPELGESGPIMANLYVQLAIVLFLVIGGHDYFLRAIFKSFVILPVDKFPSLGGNPSQFVETILRASANVLVVGMQIVAPALIAIFLVDVVMGIANRAAPQINVFFLGMPIKGYVGIVFVLLALNYFSAIVGHQFQLMLRDVQQLIYLMGGK